MRLGKPLAKRVEPNADGSYTFRTGRSAVILVRFFFGLFGLAMIWMLYDMLRGKEPTDIGTVALWVGCSTAAFLGVTALPRMMQGTLTLGNDGVEQVTFFRRTTIPWDKVNWVWTGYDVRHVPNHPGGTRRMSGNSVVSSAVSSFSADGWVVAIEDGRKNRVVVNGVNVKRYEHARFVLRRLIRERVDEGLIEDGIGFIRKGACAPVLS